MNPAQGILPGLEVYFVEPEPYQWKPRPAMLAKVKGYFQGYLANGRDIYARRKHIAEKLGVSIRTLARYLAWLAADGWIETVKRTARTAIRKVLSVQPVGSTTVPSSDPRIEETPMPKVLLRREMFTPLVVFQTVYKRFARKNEQKTRGRMALDASIDWFVNGSKVRSLHKTNGRISLERSVGWFLSGGTSENLNQKLLECAK